MFLTLRSIKQSNTHENWASKPAGFQDDFRVALAATVEEVAKGQKTKRQSYSRRILILVAGISTLLNQLNSLLWNYNASIALKTH